MIRYKLIFFLCQSVIQDGHHQKNINILEGHIMNIPTRNIAIPCVVSERILEISVNQNLTGPNSICQGYKFYDTLQPIHNYLHS
jgi:hypothetical protein